MCFLLTAFAAFADSSHAPMMRSGLVPKLVMLCRREVRAPPLVTAGALTTSCELTPSPSLRSQPWPPTLSHSSSTLLQTIPRNASSKAATHLPLVASPLLPLCPHPTIPHKQPKPTLSEHPPAPPEYLTHFQVPGGSSVGGTRAGALQTRAAAVLRNLAHNQRNHAVLIQAGAVDPLVDIMRSSAVGQNTGIM